MERIGNSAIFIGSTPRGIRRQHFREMSDALGFSSEIELAKAVVNGNESERREMLKRYYVDKNPVLSGLSSFSGTNLNEKQVVGDEKTSLERKRRDYSYETAKKSKRNLPKRSKPKSYHRDPCREEIKDLAGDRTFRSKKPRCTVTTLNSKHRAQHARFEDDPVMKEEKVNSEDKKNCGLEEAGPSHLHKTNQVEQKDVKTKSKASKCNKDFVAETQGSSLETTSELSVSILDEFLMSDSTKRSTEVKDSDARVNKWKQRDSQKGSKQLDKTKEKETLQRKKNTTSVLDEFI